MAVALLGDGTRCVGLRDDGAEVFGVQVSRVVNRIKLYDGIVLAESAEVSAQEVAGSVTPDLVPIQLATRLRCYPSSAPDVVCSICRPSSAAASTPAWINQRTPSIKLEPFGLLRKP